MENQPQTETVDLTDSQRQILGCLACVTSQETPPDNLYQSIKGCTQKANSTLAVAFDRLEDHGLIDSGDSVINASGLKVRRSNRRYELTEAGHAMLPDKWNPCEQQLEKSGPFAHATAKQRAILSCVSCLDAHGEQGTSTVIGICNGIAPDLVPRFLKPFIDRGLVHKKIVPGVRQRGGKPLINFTPVDRYKHAMPTPNKTCTMTELQAKVAFNGLSMRQKRLVRCIACLSDRVASGGIKYIESQQIEKCTSIDPRRISNVINELVADKVLMLNDVPAQVKKYSTTRSGKLLLDVSKEQMHVSCANQPKDTVNDLAASIEKCADCIWSRQITSGEEAGFTESMIRSCTGRSHSGSLWGELQKAVRQGTMVARQNTNHPRVKHWRTVLFTPPLEFEPNTFTPRGCNLPLYNRLKEAQLFMGVSPSVLTDTMPELLATEDEKVLKSLTKTGSSRVSSLGWVNRLMKHRLLKPEEEAALAVVIQNSADEAEKEQALETLTRHNFRLAVWHATRIQYAGHVLSFEERVAASFVGIYKAAQKFLPEQGTKFSTYAAYWMRQNTDLCAAKQAGIVHHIYGITPGVVHIANDLKKLLGRDASIGELAQESGHSMSLVTAALDAHTRIIGTKFTSLHKEVSAESNSTTADFVGTEETGFSDIETVMIISSIKKYLSPFEQDVMDVVLEQQDVSLAEVARKHSLTPAAANNAKKRVASLSRHPYFGLGAALRQDMSWQDEARCSKLNFKEIIDREAKPSAEAIEEVCGRCSVKQACYDFARAAQPPVMTGIWAGQSASSFSQNI